MATKPDMERLLKIWSLNEARDSSLPLSHARACAELAALCPETPGQTTLEMLRHENYVESDVHGRCLLTGKGIAARRKLPDDPRPAARPTIVRTGHEWDRFRKILSYYIDCIRQDGGGQDAFFENQRNRDFLEPVFAGIEWLKPLGTKRKIKIRIGRDQLAAMMRIRARREDDEEICIGYPVSAFKFKDGTAYSPLALIPVGIAEEGTSGTEIELDIRNDEAELNLDGLQYAYSKREAEKIQAIAFRLHEGDANIGKIDLLEILPLLERDGVVFDPENLKPLPRGRNFRKGEKRRLCNSAMLFVGNPLRYSGTLKRELMHIRDRVPDEELDRTALAYVFREPPLQDVPPKKKRMPLPFIECNPEQTAAVDAGLNSSCVKIQGPPGTGKSQVAVNLIANLVFNGNSVLFTSQNHKALSAIVERSGRILGASGVDLVQFSTKETPNPWFRQDFGLLAASAGAAMHEMPPNRDAAAKVERAAEDWRRIEEFYARRARILATYDALIHQEEERVAKMRALFSGQNGGELSEEEFHALRKHAASLRLRKKSWIVRFLLNAERRMEAARRFFQTRHPDAWENAFGEDQLVDSAIEYEILRREGKQKRLKLEEIEREARNLPPIERGRKRLERIMKEIRARLPAALLERRCRTIAELEGNAELLARLQNIQGMARSADVSPLRRGPGSKAVREMEAGFKIFARYSPARAATLLSLAKASPCFPAAFDCVIIDESSQCVPPAAVPALFRATRAVFIGDPAQFPPIVKMAPQRNQYCKIRNGVDDLADRRYDFCSRSAFDLPSVPCILLREHFRCAEEIAEYFNEVYYANRLLVRTDSGKLNFPSCMGFRHAVEWIDVPNSRKGETSEVARVVTRLLENRYPGNIGVVSPHRACIDALRERLRPVLKRFQAGDGESEKLLIATANGFQGGERDVIIFMIGLNDTLSRGGFWYAESPENRYIYNVAASRARACLILVGDRRRCAESASPWLRKLAELPKKNPNAALNAPRLFESPWEKRLYGALLSEGIETEPQYPLCGRRLDLALIRGDLKIDIEIDGVHYHTTSEGDRKIDDFYRDLQIGGMGWRVMRFWVYELRDDMAGCVRRIKAALEGTDLAKSPEDVTVSADVPRA